jgi:hypothetical protein
MSRKIVQGTSPNEDKQIVVFENDGNIFKYYSIEDGYFFLTADERAHLRKNPRSSPYILIKKNVRDHIMKDLSLKQQCKQITKDSEKLKVLTKGKINLYRTGSVAKTSLQLFYDLCNPPLPEAIYPEEIDILEAGRGQLIWGIPYKGKAYKYDISSQYPSIMASAQHKFPIGAGKLKNFTKAEFNALTYYSFGMYHVKVLDSDYRIFVHNCENWYTHTDLNFAQQQGYKIKLVEDDEPNALLFAPKALMTGRELFAPFVKFLFKLKKQGHKEI